MVNAVYSNFLMYILLFYIYVFLYNYFVLINTAYTNRSLGGPLELRLILNALLQR